ncbi:ATP synthase F0F1, B subunit [Candidatus Liberibacter americanus]|uniref:ATP synthase F(0) sector subunit b 2 n=1 Tax=Candidatus Liberibacter americanus str. Sao Paulo TaxID=1261131 RepID=U6B4Q4_9HYPH|nr:ATP synthase F0F1, B subunit [Candidatus Liberibacter americanus]AHA27875.1 ATP synthase F0F1, B subunit [Candidatus Liberibacter americanus str. Sao Paulo]
MSVNVRLLAKDNKEVQDSLIKSEAVAESDLSSKFPPFNTDTFVSQLFWLLIFFSIFYFIMHRLVVPRISSIIKLRSDRILNDRDRVDCIKKQLDTIVSSYEMELEAARAKSKEMISIAVENSLKKLDEASKNAEIDYINKLNDYQSKIYDMQEKKSKEIYSSADEVIKELLLKVAGLSVSDKKLQSVINIMQNKD